MHRFEMIEVEGVRHDRLPGAAEEDRLAVAVAEFAGFRAGGFGEGRQLG